MQACASDRVDRQLLALGPLVACLKRRGGAGPPNETCSSLTGSSYQQEDLSGRTYGNLCILAGHKLEKRALIAATLFLLIEEGKLVLLKLLEELFPGDFLEGFFGATREIYSENPGVTFRTCSLHSRGTAASLLDPPPDFVVIRCGSALSCHSVPLSCRSC